MISIDTETTQKLSELCLYASGKLAIDGNKEAAVGAMHIMTQLDSAVLELKKKSEENKREDMHNVTD